MSVRTIARGAAAAAGIGLATLLVAEGALRLFPAVIPLSFLAQFQKDLRGEIAVRRGLPSRLTTETLARDDGGPPLYIYPPHQVVRRAERDKYARPEAVMDRRGFCNTPEIAALDRYDIVALGDSFTFCLAVAPGEAWPPKLGKATGLLAYNLGKEGLGIYEYIQLLKRFGTSLEPRLVIVNIYEGNELRDAVRYRAAQGGGISKEADLLRRARSERADAPLHRRISRLVTRLKEGHIGRHSYAWNVAWVGFDRMQDLALRALASSEGNTARKPALNFRYTAAFPGGAVKMNRENGDADEVLHARALKDGRISLDIFDDALTVLADLGRRHGFRLLITYTPAAYTAYAEFARFEDTAVGELMAWFSAAQRRYFAEAAGRHGFAFLDLTPALQAAARKHAERELLYFPYNVHYTAAGHSVAAEAMAAWIKENLR